MQATELITAVAVHASGEQLESVGTTDEVVRSVSLTPPADGVVVVNSTAAIGESTAGDGVECSITTGSTVDPAHTQWWDKAGTSGSTGDQAQLAGTRGFDVIGGASVTFNLVCVHTGTATTSNVFDSALTAIYTPNP